MKSVTCFLVTTAIVSSLSISANAASAQQSVQKVGRHTVHFSEVKNDRGQMIQRTVSDGFSTEILIDINGDGAIDDWELTEGDLTVQGRYPYRGQFTTLFVTSREKKGEREMIFNLSKDAKTYELIYNKVEPYKIYYRSLGAPAPPSLVQQEATNRSSLNVESAGEECDSNPESIKKAKRQFRILFREWLAQERSAKTKKAVYQAMGSKENPLVDPSCGQKEFQQSKPDIIAAVGTVVGSTASSESGKDKRYVACLDDLGLIMYSGKIRARLSNLGPALDQDQYLIRCEHKSSEEQLGGWNKDKLQIELYQPVEKMGKNSTEEYSKTIFEELLHSAGLRDEGLARDVIDCCSNPDGNAKACASADAFVRREFSTMAYDGVFTKHSPEYENIRAQAMIDLGPNLGSVFLANYMSGLAERKLLTKEWMTANCSNRDELQCTKLFLTEVQKYNDGFFKTDCQNIFNAAGSRTENRCEHYKTEASKMIVKSLNLTNQCMEEAVPKRQGPVDAKLSPIQRESALAAMMGLMRLMGVSPASIANAKDRCEGARVWLASFTEEYENTAAPPVPPRKPAGSAEGQVADNGSSSGFASGSSNGSNAGNSTTQIQGGGGVFPGGQSGDAVVAPGSGDVTQIDKRIRTVTRGPQPVETNDRGQIPVSETRRSVPINPNAPDAAKEYLEAPRPTSAFFAPVARAVAEVGDFVPQARAETLSEREPRVRRRRDSRTRSERADNFRFTNPAPVRKEDRLDAPVSVAKLGLKSRAPSSKTDPADAAKTFDRSKTKGEPILSPTSALRKREGQASARRLAEGASQKRDLSDAGGGSGIGSGNVAGLSSGGGGGSPIAGAGSSPNRLPTSDPKHGKKAAPSLPIMKSEMQLHEFLTGDYEKFESHMVDGKPSSPLYRALSRYGVRVVPKTGVPISPPEIKKTYRYNPSTNRLQED